MNGQPEHTQKIVDLERELKFRDRRVNELKSEIEGLRQAIKRETAQARRRPCRSAGYEIASVSRSRI